MPSPLPSSSRETRRVSSMPSRAHGHHLRPPTHCDKLSEIDSLSTLPLRGLPAAWESLSQLWQVCVLGKETEVVVV